MDFIDQIRVIAARIPKQMEHIRTEEATKNALVMPFIKALGYDVFDPTEVVPEFTADVGLKKGEKVDYALLKDGKPIILFECKAADKNLDNEHFSQLLRYFHTTAARVGILTNGIVYRFFTDLDEPNKMDTKPFLELDLLDIKEAAAAETKRFSRSGYNPEELALAATELRYTKEIKLILAAQFADPSEDLIKLLVARVYAGTKTRKMMERFTEITKRALNQFITDSINDRLRSALGDTGGAPSPAVQLPVPLPAAPTAEASAGKDDGVVTTADEIEAYHIVRAILREAVDPKRVIMRDSKSYCGILLDDNNRRPICRFKFSEAKRVLILFDEAKNEEAVVLADLADIYKYADRLKATPGYYARG